MKSKHISARFPALLGRLLILAAIVLLSAGAFRPAAQAAGPVYPLYLPVISNGALNGSQNPSPQPSAQTLIQADLAARRIDANTALLYRAYAVYGDPRLPARYGGGFLLDDPSFFFRATDPNLPEALKTQLAPFLARPDDPDSIYNLDAAPSTAAEVQATDPFFCDLDDWTARTSSNVKHAFKVHARCTGDYQDDIVKAIGMMDSLWEPMTALMGPPRYDSGGPKAGYSSDIDIYLMDPLDELKRYNDDYQETGNPLEKYYASGLAPVTPPMVGVSSSGYILLDRANFANDDYSKLTLAHEFFHVLQHAHNYTLHARKDPAISDPALNDLFWWFTEASAVWASAHFVPTGSDFIHFRFSNNFQARHLPLHEPGRPGESGYIYDAYIWPFFMRQEIGAQSIANAWKGLEMVGDNWEVAMGVINQQLPFKENFRRFALRNLNVRLEPGDPVWPRYIAIDPRFPDGKALKKLNDLGSTAPRAKGDPLLRDLTVPSLDAEYEHYRFTDKVLRVDLDLSWASGLSGMAVEAVVKERGKPYAHKPLTGQQAVRLCDVEELYLIFSNEQMDIKNTAKFTYGVSPLEEACSCEQVANFKSWNGEVTVSYEIAFKNSEMDIYEYSQTNIGGRLVERYRNESSVGFIAAEPFGNGKFSYHEIRLHDDGSTYLVGAYEGNGPPVPFNPQVLTGSRILFSLDLNECSYSFYVSNWIGGTYQDEESGPSPVTMIGIAHAGSDEIAMPANPLAGLNGSAIWPGHSSGYIETQMESHSYYLQDDYFLLQALGEDNLGTAQVTWKFTPSEEP